MKDRFQNPYPKFRDYVLTEGGLQRTLKLGMTSWSLR